MPEAPAVDAIGAVPAGSCYQLPIAMRRLSAGVAQGLPARAGMIDDIALVVNCVLPRPNEGKFPHWAFGTALAGLSVQAVASVAPMRPVKSPLAIDAVAPRSAVNTVAAGLSGRSIKATLARRAITTVNAVAAGLSVLAVPQVSQPLRNVRLDATSRLNTSVKLGKARAVLRLPNLTLALRFPAQRRDLSRDGLRRGVSERAQRRWHRCRA